jgi:hypothetical protein
MEISKHKLKNFLAEKVACNLLQQNEEDLFNHIRYDGIKGFEQYGDAELFAMLQETIPEFQLVGLQKTDNNSFFLEVDKKHGKNEQDIKVDIIRIIQMKMLV